MRSDSAVISVLIALLAIGVFLVVGPALRSAVSHAIVDPITVQLTPP